MTDGGTSTADIARRIVALRTALGMNQAAFAKLVDFSQPALSNYESGLRRPELEKAMAITSRTGATLDWIYMGVRAGLPHHLSERLAPFPDAARKTG